MAADTLASLRSGAGQHPQYFGAREKRLAKVISDGIQFDTAGALTQAQIIAMFTTPVTLIAAPGAGKAIIVDEIEFFHDFDTAAYTGGGDVSVEYGSGADVVLADATLITGAADAKTLARPTIYDLDATTGTGIGFDMAAQANQALRITNATAVFAAGSALNVLKYRIRHHVVTLLT